MEVQSDSKVEILEPENSDKSTDQFDQAVKSVLKNDRLVVDKGSQTILPLDFSGIVKVKEQSPENYKSKNILTPKTDKDHKKYYEIYVKFVSQNHTQLQLADEYDLSPTHINRIIKWATFQLGEIDNDQELKIMIDNLRMRKQEIMVEKVKLIKMSEEKPGQETKSEVDRISKCWKAELQIDRLLANITKLSNNKVVEINNDNRSMNIKTGEGFQRRTGSELSESPKNELPEVKPESLPTPNPQDQQPIINVERGHHG